MAVMGSGDIIIAGSNPPSRKRKTVTVKNPAKGAGGSSPQRNAPTPGKAETHCGAMSQQRTNSGAASTPQKFLRLVGCGDSKVRPRGGR
jgi:hypothetical protein